MKKIPTLFKRTYENHNVVNISDELTDDNLRIVLEGKCIPTLKMDGACCAYFNDVFYKRYDAKKGKKPPVDAIPCCEPDSVTGHWPHWIPIKKDNPSDKWFLEAVNNYKEELTDGTYEAIGLHFQGNPYNLKEDTLYRHGSVVLPLSDFSFEGIQAYLSENYIEGIVFWYNGNPLCKVKRKDFGLSWK